MNKCVSIRVSGRVQNVGFRYFAIKEAGRFHINGFVRNENDGSVYIEASGTEEQLDRFVISINQGPSWGRVDGIQVTVLPATNYKGFSVRH